MMIDDVTFERAARPLEVTFLGYYVYRNGQRITPEPIQTTSFTDTSYNGGANYYVTVAYDLGESDASNIVSLGEACLSYGQLCSLLHGWPFFICSAFSSKFRAFHNNYQLSFVNYQLYSLPLHPTCKAQVKGVLRQVPWLR